LIRAKHFVKKYCSNCDEIVGTALVDVIEKTNSQVTLVDSSSHQSPKGIIETLKKFYNENVEEKIYGNHLKSFYYKIGVEDAQNVISKIIEKNKEIFNKLSANQELIDNTIEKNSLIKEITTILTQLYDDRLAEAKKEAERKQKERKEAEKKQKERKEKERIDKEEADKVRTKKCCIIV
jgi:hypothetical protein